MTEPLLTTDAMLERLADLVAERINTRLAANASNDDALLDASEVARRYGLTRSWCYEHAGQLGAIRIGNGSRPRIRFNPDTVEHHLTSLAKQPAATPTTRTRRRKSETPGRTTSGAPLLQIKDSA